MDIMHAKRKAAIFTLSRQQKITPNCKGWGELCGCGVRGGGCWEAGRLASKGFFFFSLSLSAHV